MDTVKKDIERLKEQVGLMKQTLARQAVQVITHDLALESHMQLLNNARDKIVLNNISLGLIERMIFKDSKTEQDFEDHVKELRKELYEKMNIKATDEEEDPNSTDEEPEEEAKGEAEEPDIKAKEEN